MNDNDALTLSLESLSEEEKKLILGVIKRDEELTRAQHSRVNQLRTEVHNLRMQSVLRPGDDLAKMCARCHKPLGRIFDTGDVCPQCKFKVCKVCRESVIGRGWMCTLCGKQAQLAWLSGEWMYKSRRGRRPSGSDIIKASLRLSVANGRFYDDGEGLETSALKDSALASEARGLGNLNDGGGGTSRRSASRDDIDRVGYPQDSDRARLTQLFDSFRSGRSADSKEGAQSVQRVSCRRKRDSSSSSAEDDDEVVSVIRNSKCQDKNGEAGGSRATPDPEGGKGPPSSVSFTSSEPPQDKSDRESVGSLPGVDSPTVAGDIRAARTPSPRLPRSPKPDARSPTKQTRASQAPRSPASPGSSSNRGRTESAASRSRTVSDASDAAANSATESAQQVAAAVSTPGATPSRPRPAPASSSPRPDAGQAEARKEGPATREKVEAPPTLTVTRSGDVPTHVRRTSSERSDASSFSSARTASPATKMRLLDLASSRALEREASDLEERASQASLEGGGSGSDVVVEELSKIPFRRISGKGGSGSPRSFDWSEDSDEEEMERGGGEGELVGAGEGGGNGASFHSLSSHWPPGSALHSSPSAPVPPPPEPQPPALGGHSDTPAEGEPEPCDESATTIEDSPCPWNPSNPPPPPRLSEAGEDSLDKPSTPAEGQPEPCGEGATMMGDTLSCLNSSTPPPSRPSESEAGTGVVDPPPSAHRSSRHAPDICRAATGGDVSSGAGPTAGIIHEDLGPRAASPGVEGSPPTPSALASSVDGAFVADGEGGRAETMENRGNPICPSAPLPELQRCCDIPLEGEDPSPSQSAGNWAEISCERGEKASRLEEEANSSRLALAGSGGGIKATTRAAGKEARLLEDDDDENEKDEEKEKEEEGRGGEELEGKDLGQGERQMGGLVSLVSRERVAEPPGAQDAVLVDGAEVLDLRRPQSEVPAMLRRYLSNDDSASDTLSIITELSEPECLSDDASTISQASSQGTLHGDLDLDVEDAATAAAAAACGRSASLPAPGDDGVDDAGDEFYDERLATSQEAGAGPGEIVREGADHDRCRCSEDVGTGQSEPVSFRPEPPMENVSRRSAETEDGSPPDRHSPPPRSPAGGGRAVDGGNISRRSGDVSCEIERSVSNTSEGLVENEEAINVGPDSERREESAPTASSPDAREHSSVDDIPPGLGNGSLKEAADEDAAAERSTAPWSATQPAAPPHSPPSEVAPSLPSGTMDEGLGTTLASSSDGAALHSPSASLDSDCVCEDSAATQLSSSSVAEEDASSLRSDSDSGIVPAVCTLGHEAPRPLAPPKMALPPASQHPLPPPDAVTQFTLASRDAVAEPLLDSRDAEAQSPAAEAHVTDRLPCDGAPEKSELDASLCQGDDPSRDQELAGPTARRPDAANAPTPKAAPLCGVGARAGSNESLPLSSSAVTPPSPSPAATTSPRALDPATEGQGQASPPSDPGPSSGVSPRLAALRGLKVGGRKAKPPTEGKTGSLEQGLEDTNSLGGDSGHISATSQEYTPDPRGLSPRHSPRHSHLSIPSVTGSADDEDEDIDRLVASHRSVSGSHLSGSRSNLYSQLGGSRESIASVYSDAGEINYGKFPVTGEILFGLDYNYKTGSLEIHIKQCKDIAMVDAKHKRSDPYVKTYLLPDKTRTGKRKTKIKKHTLNPTFDEILRYNISKSELENRSLWLTVWHNDRLGRNDFLGEVMIPLDCYKFGDPSPRWYPLQERLEAPGQSSLMAYRGDLLIAVKFVSADQINKSSPKKPKSRKFKGETLKGELHVVVKEARNLTAVRANESSDPFCKGYLLPEKGKHAKQKTQVIKKNCNPAWHHMFVFEDVDQDELKERSLELTVWDYDKLTSNDFLGGVRLNFGTGQCLGKPADWMDARGEEIAAWQLIVDHPNSWMDFTLTLRSSMGKDSVKK